MKIKKIQILFVIVVALFIGSSVKTNAQSLTDIYDMGVNFGQAEIFGRTEYVANTAIPNAKKHAINSRFFRNIDAEFMKLENGNISGGSVEAVRINFDKQLNYSPRLLHIFDLGILMGQIEAYAQIGKVSNYPDIDGRAIPQAMTHASALNVQNNVSLFAQLKAPNRTVENFERTTVAIRLTLRELINPLKDKNIFRAGAFKQKLTANIGENLVGYYLKCETNQYRPATGTRKGDGLFVRAVVLDDGILKPIPNASSPPTVQEYKTTKIAIVSVDSLLIYSRNINNIKPRVQAITGIDNIILVATHSHSTPEFSPTCWADATLIRQREDRITTAIIHAAGSLEPAEIGTDSGIAKEGFNRVQRKVENNIKSCCLQFSLKNELEGNYNGRENYLASHKLDHIDNTVGVIKIQRSTDKQTIALLVNYAMHGVVFGDDNTEISADWMGEFANTIEFQFGIEQELPAYCLFLQGAAGDINPWTTTLPAIKADREVKIIGKNIAKEVWKVSRRINQFQNSPQLSFLSKNVQIEPEDSNTPTDGSFAEINTIAIGDNLAIATFPGEFFTDFGLQLKNRSPFTTTMFVGYTNHALGYFSTKDYFQTSANCPDPRIATTVKRGTGENLVSEAINMLNAQKSKK